MSNVMIRIAVALAFVAAQFAPALHAFHAEEEFAEHCTDGESSTHWCACTLDHDAPECTLCAHVAQGAVVVPSSAHAPDVADTDAAAFSTDVVRSTWLALSGPPRGPPPACGS